MIMGNTGKVFLGIILGILLLTKLAHPRQIIVEPVGGVMVLVKLQRELVAKPEIVRIAVE